MMAARENHLDSRGLRAAPSEKDTRKSMIKE